MWRSGGVENEHFCLIHVVDLFVSLSITLILTLYLRRCKFHDYTLSMLKSAFSFCAIMDFGLPLPLRYGQMRTDDHACATSNSNIGTPLDAQPWHRMVAPKVCN